MASARERAAGLSGVYGVCGGIHELCSRGISSGGMPGGAHAPCVHANTAVIVLRRWH